MNNARSIVLLPSTSPLGPRHDTKHTLTGPTYPEYDAMSHLLGSSPLVLDEFCLQFGDTANRSASSMEERLIRLRCLNAFPREIRKMLRWVVLVSKLETKLGLGLQHLLEDRPDLLDRQFFTLDELSFVVLIDGCLD